jgi:hypothetical protein
LGDPLKENLLLLYKPLHLEAQQVSTRIEVRRHQITRARDYIKRCLMKMHFSFVFLLALSTVIDLHVKLQRTDMVVEDHEETLMKVMVFCKLRPAALELSPVHELGELQWHPLNLAALSAGDAEKGVYLGRRRRRNIL